MKLKPLFVFFLLSIFFLATQSSATEPQDKILVTSEVSIEVSEQLEETEDNRNSLQPIFLLSYFTLDSYVVFYDPSFFLRDNFTDIEKPPILKI